MADVLSAPLGLNQAGLLYPAEYLRAQHYSATSGGNGVDTPDALKVVAQSAPDGSVSVVPGGATLRSTYAGAQNQSYHGAKFAPSTLTVPPTGSASGGRHDLVVMRVHDPQYGDVPDGWPGGEVSEEHAAEFDYLPFQILEGKSASTKLDFPHVKLAHIRRGPNQTIVRPEDIVDLRELANAKSNRFVDARNLDQSEEQPVSSATNVFPTAATQYVHIPEFATRVQVIAMWGTVRAVASQSRTSGRCHVELTHPDGSSLQTQISRFSVPYNTAHETRFNIMLGHQLALPVKWRGQDVRVRMMAQKETGLDAYMDGASSYTIDLHFQQEVA